MARFRLELIKRARNRGLWQMICQGVSMLLATGPYIYIFGFRRDCHDGFVMRDDKDSKVRFHNYKDWENIPDTIKALLTDFDTKKTVGFKTVLERRWRLWVGTRENGLAMYGWTRTAKESADFFFPIGENSVLIWYTETLPDHRGLGLLPLMLDHMVHTLAGEGIETVYITSAKFNFASRRGIEKANAQLIGRGIMKAGSGQGVIWFPASQQQPTTKSVRQ